MKKVTLLLCLLGFVSLTHVEDACIFKTVRVPVVQVTNRHQEIDLPETAGTCVNGTCEAHTVEIDYFSTEPNFEIVIMYKGENYAFESPLEPTSSTIPVQVQECGKTHTPRIVKPTV